MTLAAQIGIGAVVGLFVGFAVGYFVWIIIRWRQKKNAHKLIEKQNLKFKFCERDSLQGVIKNDKQTNKETRQADRGTTESQRKHRENPTRFGRKFR